MAGIPETIVIVPGLRGHDDDHWQSRLAAAHPGARVVPPERRDDPRLGERVALIDRAVREVAGPVIVVAHSAGVLATVHWAARHQRPIAGALLVTPPALATPLPPGYPSLATLRDHGWLPVPRQPLPFPSTVALSSDDPLGNPVRIRALARPWGSRLVDVGAVGHLNPAAGYGYWPRAEALLRDLSGTVQVRPEGQGARCPVGR